MLQDYLITQSSSPEVQLKSAARVYERQTRSITELTKFDRVARLSAGVRNSGNAIVHGDNLAVLDAIQDSYCGKVRCIYLDPPYNNGEIYTHYSDDLDHAQWLQSIEKRLHLLAPLLTPDGSLWISIDDSEAHYLKVACDSILGRKNFVSSIIWQQRTTRENRRVFSNNHEYLLVYAKDLRRFSATRNQLAPTSDFFRRYKNPDNDPKGPWQSVSANVQAGHATPSQFYSIKAPNGTIHRPPKGRCWVYNKEKMQSLISRGELWFGRDGKGVPRLKRYLKETSGLTPSTLWPANEVGTTLAAKKHLLQLFPNLDLFDTPKPESLIARVLEISTDPGDLVFDPYLGSGTTAAVAHKMNRQYLGIELGQHAITHCAERLRQVVNGDLTGASDKFQWQGGGGFDFLRFTSAGNGRHT